MPTEEQRCAAPDLTTSSTGRTRNPKPRLDHAIRWHEITVPTLFRQVNQPTINERAVQTEPSMFVRSSEFGRHIEPPQDCCLGGLGLVAYTQALRPSCAGRMPGGVAFRRTGKTRLTPLVEARVDDHAVTAEHENRSLARSVHRESTSVRRANPSAMQPRAERLKRPKPGRETSGLAPGLGINLGHTFVGNTPRLM